MTLFEERDRLMPALFAGHGNPMYAIKENRYRQKWHELGRTLPRPEAVLCISAHWQSRGTQLCGLAQPPTIHDFYGFPPALFDVEYPAPGSPELAALVAESLAAQDEGGEAGIAVRIVEEWGLDHGAWSVLSGFYPDADVPIVQLSLDRDITARQHYAIGRRLAFLRRRGVMVVGSGNIVHNLQKVVWSGEAKHDWALEFDAKIRDAILAGDDEAVIDYGRFGEAARLSVPTDEHYLPLLYILAMREEEDRLSFFNEGVEMGSLSMRSLLLSGS